MRQRYSDGSSRAFSISIGSLQGSALSPYLCALDMSICYILRRGSLIYVANDIVLVDDTSKGLHHKLEIWYRRGKIIEPRYSTCKFDFSDSLLL